MPIASKFSNELNPKKIFLIVFELLTKQIPIKSYSISKVLSANNEKLKLLFISFTI